MNFKEWLKQSGLNSYMVSKLCGVSPSTIKSLVDGKNAVSAKTVRRLIMKTKYMGVPVQWEMFSKIIGKRRER
jgi:plasmid maintenance system antidote protein VapI